MGRFRSFIRKVAKPAAMAAVAGMLAVSLTVTTTQKAEANPLIALPVVMAAESAAGAAIPLVMPSLAATVLAVTPVGWVIAGGVAVAALALGAYYTKDFWLPWVQGQFGAPTGNANTPAATGTPNVDPGVTMTELTVSGGTATFKGTTAVPAGTSDYYFGISIQLRCNSSADGSGTAQPSTATSRYSYYNKTLTRNWTFTAACDYGSVVGAIGGAKGGDPLLTVQQTGAGPTNVLRWGNLVTTGGGFDPKGSDVKYRTTVECIDDNGAKSTLTADWLGSDGGAKFPSCAAAGKGHGTGVNKVEGFKPASPGVVGTVPETIWSTAAPAVDPNYSKCDQGRAGAGCEMKILIDGKPCVIGQWECANWSDLWKDPATSARVGCTYGPYTLSPDACSIMEPAYRPGGAPLTEENTDGNPSTKNNTGLSGQPFTPETKPSTVPGGAGVPAPSNAAASTCWPQGWAIFNPMWIYDSLNCAFVPKTDLQQRIQTTVNTAGTLPPMSWFNAVNMTAPGGASCPNWTVHVGGFSENVICGSSFTDALRGSRNLIFTMLAGAMVWPLIRSLWYASIPFIRVSPGSSK